ncbi:unnamed protein product, partial [Polarella glacialis]
ISKAATQIEGRGPDAGCPRVFPELLCLASMRSCSDLGSIRAARPAVLGSPLGPLPWRFPLHRMELSGRKLAHELSVWCVSGILFDVCCLFVCLFRAVVFLPLFAFVCLWFGCSLVCVACRLVCCWSVC